MNDFCQFFPDRYVIVENLRYMLEAVDPQMPIYYGCKFKPFVRQGYMSGGAGNYSYQVLFFQF